MKKIDFSVTAMSVAAILAASALAFAPIVSSVYAADGNGGGNGSCEDGNSQGGKCPTKPGSGTGTTTPGDDQGEDEGGLGAGGDDQGQDEGGLGAGGDDQGEDDDSQGDNDNQGEDDDNQGDNDDQGEEDDDQGEDDDQDDDDQGEDDDDDDQGEDDDDDNNHGRRHRRFHHRRGGRGETDPCVLNPLAEGCTGGIDPTDTPVVPETNPCDNGGCGGSTLLPDTGYFTSEDAGASAQMMLETSIASLVVLAMGAMLVRRKYLRAKNSK